MFGLDCLLVQPQSWDWAIWRPSKDHGSGVLSGRQRLSVGQKNVRSRLWMRVICRNVLCWGIRGWCARLTCSLCYCALDKPHIIFLHLKYMRQSPQIQWLFMLDLLPEKQRQFILGENGEIHSHGIFSIERKFAPRRRKRLFLGHILLIEILSGKDI